MEKVNQHSTVEVSSADFEQVVSANVERDIQNELVLAPLFREIQMTSANQIIPIYQMLVMLSLHQQQSLVVQHHMVT